MTKEWALKLCLRVLRPIAEDRIYETRWLGDAIKAAEEALAHNIPCEVLNENIPYNQHSE